MTARLFREAEWIALREDVKRTEEVARAAERRLVHFEALYMMQNKLTVEQIGRLTLHLMDHEGLCCEEGLDRLRKIVDPIWAKHINGYAYERMGCRSTSSEWPLYPAKLVEIIATLERGDTIK